jgi:hypothetical protein
MVVDVVRTLSSFVLACLLPVILAAGSCLACFSIVSQNPSSTCCKHRNQCQDKTSHSDCLDQAANPGQAQPSDSITVTQSAPVIPELELLAPMARRVFPVLIPPGGEASPPGLFVLHSSFLI